MIFFKQLRLLCWKNWKHQYRQKKRLLAEILWPLTLFLILMWVRTRELKLYFKECHFEQKAMPTTGFLPFIQTFLCTMNNTCHNQHVENLDKIITLYNKSILTNFVDDLSALTRDFTPENKKMIRTILENINNLNLEELNEVSGPESQVSFVETLLGPTSSPFELPLKIVQLNKLVTSARKILGRFQNINLTQSLNNTNQISEFVCGEKVLANESSLIRRASNMLPMFSRRFKRVRRPKAFDKNNETACPVFASILGDNLWRMVKPLMAGKILYYPDTKSTRKIMDKVNKNFEGFKTANDLTNEWLYELSPRFRQMISEENSTFIAVILNFDRNFTKSQLIEFANSIDFIALALTEFFKCFEFNKIEGIKRGADVDNTSQNLNEEDRLWALIEFDDKMKYDGSKLPKYIKYKIRMDAYRTSPTRTLRRPPPPAPRRMPMLHLQYLYFGFAFLQDMVERAIINEQSNRTINTGLWLQQFPFPCYITDRFILAIGGTFPLFMILAWVYPSAMLIRSIVYEKEFRLKEVMKSMGLRTSVYWISWFMDAFITVFISVISLSFILKFGSILTFSNPFITFLLLLSFAIATIAFCFLLSTFFGQANISAVAGGLIYFIFHLPYGFLVRWEEYISNTIRTIASFSSNVAFGFGCSYFAHMEEAGVGVQWDNFGGSEEIPEYSFTMQDVIVLILIDAFIYFLLALYIEAVFPGMYGLPKAWYCCLQPLVPRRQFRTDVEKIEDEQSIVQSLDFEAEPTHSRLGIAIKHLGKVYNDGKVAVHDLNLNFYEDQITAFLGQNGAGKTTTISILTGLFPPTSGTAVINGCDIRKQMSEIRHNLGMCPQFNVLFDKLTVCEHLWFYANLKHSDKPIAVYEEIQQLIKDVGLEDKTNVQSYKLSGGMLRKLSICVAFVGGSKVIILDEPTAGVDPQSRRAIWDMLLKYKKGRTIVLTTHFMDEADILGDRIAIISNGKIRCCGSNLFLKKRFGKGYYLTVIKKDQNDKTVLPKMSEFVKKFVQNSQMKDEFGFEVKFILPFDQMENFKSLLSNLQNNKEKLGISEFGISDAKLEEIFLKVCDSDEDLEKQETQTEPLLPTEVPYLHKATGLALIMHQTRALIMKKFYHSIRNPKSIFAELILPVVFICLAFILIIVAPPITSYPPLELHLYQQPRKNYIFFNEIPAKSDLMESYIDSLINMPYLGTRCVTGNPIEKQCLDLKDNPSNLRRKTSLYHNESCSCDHGIVKCSTEAMDYDVPINLLRTDDNLINVTGHNVVNWLLNTHSKYYLIRQGGFTIGQEFRNRDTNWCDLLGVLHMAVNTTLWNNATVLANVANECKPSENHGNVKVWFNNRNSISSMAYFNAINNVILRAALPNRKDARSYGISVTNHPLSLTAEQALENLRNYGFFTLLQAVTIVFAMSFVPASFVLFLINERISKFKHLQLISGVKAIVYWCVHFLWDYMMYTMTVILCIIIFLAFNDASFTSKTNFIPISLLLLSYGFATIPLMYIFSFVFSISSLAFVVLSCTNLFLGIASTLSVFVLEIFADEDEELENIYITLRQAFLIFPQYCLGRGLIEVKTHQQQAEILEEFGYESIANPLDWDFIGRNIVCLLIVGCLSFSIVLIIEYKLFNKLSQRLCSSNDEILNLPLFEDEDVAAESEKVYMGTYNNAVLRVQKLRKVYDSRPWYFPIKNFIVHRICRSTNEKVSKVFQAVDRLSFGVNKGECFGLLGANGAGKTTTFKMLTGDIDCTSGDAYLLGHSIRTNMPEVRKYLGYCPQFNALNEYLTCKEHLKLFATLKGIHPDDVDKAVDWTVRKLNLESHLNKKAGTYSGGNKRKLCTAIAIIGNPPIIYLDEPTTGMDPKSRRFLWDCILSLVKSGQSIVLTSHSLEECEALCSRLAIMVEGRFRCFGSVQHLKNRLGGGYFLIVRVTNPDYMNGVFDFVNSQFPMAVIKEHHSTYARFSLPQNDLIVSDLFEKMEKNKTRLGIADYSISQTTLDQVFLSFASEET